MARTIAVIICCGFLSGCSLRVAAAATAAALEVYSTAYITMATPEERAELKDTLEAIKPYTDQVAAGVDAKLALIASLEGE